MLSPGKYYQFIPKEPDRNVRWRVQLLQDCAKNAFLRMGVLRMCEEDVIFAINAFAWQFNPDQVGDEVGPFITWDFQEPAIREVLDAVEAREDVRWQKSREVGASWVVLFVIWWLCNFHENKKALVVSRDEDSVDRPDDPDCLFWKLDFLHEHLPDWVKGGHDTIKRRKMGINYQHTRSSINGEANTVTAGVGGRATIALFDEFGQFRNGEETYSFTSDTSHCRVFVFTHKDRTGMAYKLCFDAKFSGMREIITHWSQHPLKNKGLYRWNEQNHKIDILDKGHVFPDGFPFVMEKRPVGGPFPGLRSPWYDIEDRRRTERDRAMNLDIDPKGSSDLFFDSYRIAVLKAEYVTEPVWRGSLLYNKATGQPQKLVPDPLGQIKMWVQPKSDVAMPDMRCTAGVDISAGTGYSPSCLTIMRTTGEKVLEYVNALIYPPEFATFVVAMCRMFKSKDGINPFLAWEIQFAQSFSAKVSELNYGPCYIERDEEILGRPWATRMRHGLHMSPASIKHLLETYRDALYEQKCIVRSEYSLDETLNFVYTTGGVEYKGTKKAAKIADEGSGARVHHGDIVVADALAYKMVVELGRTEFEEEQNGNKWLDPRTLEGRIKLFEIAERDVEWI